MKDPLLILLFVLILALIGVSVYQEQSGTIEMKPSENVSEECKR